MTQPIDSIFAISKTRKNKPARIVIHGPHKIGKSTFGRDAPASVFIQVEDGLDAIDADAFPVPSTSEEAIAQIQWLAFNEHPHKTVVLDTADWLDAKIQRDVLAAAGVDSMARVGSHGEGWKRVTAVWQRVLSAFDACREQRGMTVIILAHSQNVTVNNPATEPYDSTMIDLTKGSRQLVCEWADVIGCADYPLSVVTEQAGFTKSKRGVGSDERVLRLAPNPAWQAGSRWTMPPELPFTWADFSAALDAARANAPAFTPSLPPEFASTEPPANADIEL